MAKTTKNAKVVKTPKELAKEHLNEVLEIINRCGVPTFSFKVGDVVSCGNLKDCILNMF